MGSSTSYTGKSFPPIGRALKQRQIKVIQNKQRYNTERKSWHLSVGHVREFSPQYNVTTIKGPVTKDRLETQNPFTPLETN